MAVLHWKLSMSCDKPDILHIVHTDFGAICLPGYVESSWTRKKYVIIM